MEQTRKRRHEDDIEPESLSRTISPPKKRARESPVISSPWQLTWIQDVPEALNQDAVTLKDLLGDPMIAECWEFNFLHDIPFLMDAFDPDTRHIVKVHIVHGFWKREDPQRLRLLEEASQYSNVELHVAPMNEMFGTHHSKMMILFRHDDTAQVIIHTANMIPRDWTNMTNAVWKSPLLPRITSSAEQSGRSLGNIHREAGNNFKTDLLNYLRAYEQRRPTCHAVIDKLQNFDFSAIKAVLIASVPGRHSVRDSSQTSWGWAALSNQLRNVPCQPGPSQLVIQISSIATLGATDSWLRNLVTSLSTSSKKGLPPPKVQVIFPTPAEIRQSLDGYASGGSIHTKIQSKQQASQLAYLQKIFHHWASEGDREEWVGQDERITGDGGRSEAAPHIKTYIRYNGRTIDWALLTSANLSKQAWGGDATVSESHESHLRIASWEIGVLVWPDLIQDGSLMVPSFRSDIPDRPIWDDGEKPIVGVRIPYSMPLHPYASGEVPWVATLSHTEPDRWGNQWGM